MLEGSRVVMPRLADCSSGRTEIGFCEPGLAASACDCAAIEPDNAPINVAPSSKRWPRGQLILGFIHASMERIPSGFKIAISSQIHSQIQIQRPVQNSDPYIDGVIFWSMFIPRFHPRSVRNAELGIISENSRARGRG